MAAERCAGAGGSSSGTVFTILIGGISAAGRRGMVALPRSANGCGYYRRRLNDQVNDGDSAPKASIWRAQTARECPKRFESACNFLSRTQNSLKWLRFFSLFFNDLAVVGWCCKNDCAKSNRGRVLRKCHAAAPRQPQVVRKF